MPKYGAYSKDIVLARPDKRTREGRLLRQMRDSLFAHFGGETNLSAPQRILVERAAMLQLRVATFDEKLVNGTFSEHDSRAYLAFSNSLTRTMKALGLEPAAVKPTDPMAALRAHIASRTGEAA